MEKNLAQNSVFGEKMTNIRYEFIGAVFVKCSMFDMKRSSKVFFSVQGCFESKESSFLILDNWKVELTFLSLTICKTQF